jgi:hypothetical protein
MAKKWWVIPLGIVASLISGGLIVSDYRSIIDVLQFADPTGLFGVYLHLGGLLANAAIIFVTVCVVLRWPRFNFGFGYAAVAFAALVLTASAALPCFLSVHPGSLCGVWFVVAFWVAIPVILAAAIAFIATSRSKAVMMAAVGASVAFLGLMGAAQLQFSPSEPSQCQVLAEMTKRSECLNHFAKRAADENICRSIEFRTTRFTCLREVALKNGKVQLCEEISDTSSIHAYESPAAFYRDACFQNMAYSLHNRSQCAKVEDQQLRASCEKDVR